MPFNVTRSWETPRTYENAHRLAGVERCVQRSDGAVRFALRLIARAAAGATPPTRALKAAAQFATDGNAAIAEAHADVRAGTRSRRS